MDSDNALWFDLTASQHPESPAIVESTTDTPTCFSPQAIDALEISTNAVGVSADEEDKEAGDVEQDEGGADEDDEEESEDEAEE